MAPITKVTVDRVVQAPPAVSTASSMASRTSSMNAGRLGAVKARSSMTSPSCTPASPRLCDRDKD